MQGIPLRDSGCFSHGNHCRDSSLPRSGSASWFWHVVMALGPSFLSVGLHVLICKWVWLDLTLGWALQKQLLRQGSVCSSLVKQGLPGKMGEGVGEPEQDPQARGRCRWWSSECQPYLSGSSPGGDAWPAAPSGEDSRLVRKDPCSCSPGIFWGHHSEDPHILRCLFWDWARASDMILAVRGYRRFSWDVFTAEAGSWSPFEPFILRRGTDYPRLHSMLVAGLRLHPASPGLSMMAQPRLR